MAEPIRRRVLDSSAGVDFLSGLIPPIQAAAQQKQKQNEAYQTLLAKFALDSALKKQDQANKIAQIQASASAKTPSAADQIKQKILDISNVEGQPAQPMGGYNQAELNQDMPAQVQAAARARQLAILNGSINKQPAQSNPTYVLNSGTSTAQPVTDSSGQIVHGRVINPGYAGQTSNEDLKQAVEGIATGDVPPTEVSYRDRTRLAAEAKRQGLDLMKLQNDYTSMQSFAKNANSSMQLRMRQALESVGQSIPQLSQLNQEFKRTGWTPANAVELKAAITGTDPTKRDQATRFMSQIALMKDELAQGFMGGGVPTDRAFKLADDVMSPLYGAKQMDVALNQLQTNLKIRLSAINSIEPIYLNGQASSQQQQSSQSADAETVKARLRAKYGNR